MRSGVESGGGLFSRRRGGYGLVWGAERRKTVGEEARRMRSGVGSGGVEQRRGGLGLAGLGRVVDGLTDCRMLGVERTVDRGGSINQSINQSINGAGERTVDRDANDAAGHLARHRLQEVGSRK